MSSTETKMAPVLADMPAGRGEETALIALRQDLLEPIQAIVSLVGVLLHELRGHEECPQDLVADVGKLHDASERLLEFVQDIATPASATQAQQEIEARLRRVRHDLGNRLNHVSGFCQLLMYRQETEFFGAFQSDLDRIHSFCKECEQNLLRWRSAPSPAAARPAAVTTPGSTYRAPAPIPADILIVDDSSSSREVFRRMLKGHHIAEAANGEEALRMMTERFFDLVLLDYLMPAMNGVEVLQHLRAAPKAGGSSIIVISGVEDAQNAIRCIELGAEDYLTKPIDHLLLQARVNSCLEKRRLQQRQLEQFFPPQIARHMMHRPELLQEGREAEVTVLFCDIRGFSRIAERLPPESTVAWVGSVLEMFSQEVLHHDGVVVDYQGDQVMAMWGVPEAQPDHAQRACRTALSILAALPGLSDDWLPTIKTATDASIGINTGLARVGNIGTRRKLKYGPLGNTVNVAARVQGATKYLKTRLLITGETRKQLPDGFHVRRLSSILANNIETPLDLYELLPMNRANWAELRDRYEQALALFEEKKLKETAQLLSTLMSEYGADGPELSLMSRTIQCLLEPQKWRREWDLPGK